MPSHRTERLNSDFRRELAMTFVEDMNDILETDSFSILGYPFAGTVKS